MERKTVPFTRSKATIWLFFSHHDHWDLAIRLEECSSKRLLFACLVVLGDVITKWNVNTVHISGWIMFTNSSRECVFPISTLWGVPTKQVLFCFLFLRIQRANNLRVRHSALSNFLLRSIVQGLAWIQGPQVLRIPQEVTVFFPFLPLWASAWLRLLSFFQCLHLVAVPQRQYWFLFPWCVIRSFVMWSVFESETTGKKR